MRFRLLAAAGLVGATLAVTAPGGTALACSCEEFTLEKALAEGDVAFVGRAVERNLEGAPGEDPVRWTMEVDDVVKGDVPLTVDVWSGEGDGDCGVQFEIGEPVGVIARRRGGRLLTNSCGGEWLPSELLTPGTLAAPTSAGPPALVVVGRTGDASLASYDAAGQLVGWGRGADLINPSVCPGGDVLAGQAFVDEGTAVVRYDVAALSPLDDTRLEGRPEGAWPEWADNRGFACTSADGDVAFLLTATGYEPGSEHNSLVVVDGPAVRLHAVGDAWDFAFDPTLSTGVLLTGPTGTAVERINLADGTRHVLAELPGGAGGRAVAVDEATGRIAVLASSDPELARWEPPGVDRLAVLDGDGGVISDVAIGGGGGAGHVRWLPDERLLLYWDLGPLRIDVVGLDGTVQSSFEPGEQVWGTPAVLAERVHVPGEDGVVTFALDGTDRRELSPGIARATALAAVPGASSTPAGAPTTTTATVAPAHAPASTAATSAPTTGPDSTRAPEPGELAGPEPPLAAGDRPPPATAGDDDGAGVWAIIAVASAVAVAVAVIAARRRAGPGRSGRPPATMAG